MRRGVVVERLPDARFRARLDDGRELTCFVPRVCAPTRRRAKGIDRRLLRLIRDFQAAVRRAVEAMRAIGVEPPATRTAWWSTQLPQGRRRQGLYRFRKHGSGLRCDGPGLRVDFDFGDDGELDGFDAWRLGEFAAGRLARYGFTRRCAIERAFDDALVAGHIRRRGSAWHLARPDDGTA